MVDDPVQDAVLARLRRELARALGLAGGGADLELDSRLREDLGVGSLKLVNLVVQLEETYDIAIDDDELGSLVTLRDLVELVTRKTAGQAPGAGELHGPVTLGE